MIERYSRKEIKKIWDEKNKYQIWLDIEIAATQAMEKLKIIPKGVSAKVKRKATINVDRINKIESKVHHDVIAFLTSITEKVGSEGKYLHKGMTSSDVVDTCFNIQLLQSGKIIIKDINEILNVLKENAFTKALSHCFSSNITFAQQLVDLNILLSFSGNVTFKNSSNHSAVENIGLDNFVLETDCPFLSPHPFRGKPNEPKRVYDIALYLSELLGISIEEIADATSKNAMQFFNID